MEREAKNKNQTVADYLEILLEDLKEMLDQNVNDYKTLNVDLTDKRIRVKKFIKFLENRNTISEQIDYLKAGKKSDKLERIEQILPDINLICKDSTLAQWEQFINGDELTDTIRIKTDSSLKHFIQFYDNLKQNIGINHTDKLTEKIKAFRFDGANVTANQMKHARNYSKKKPN